MVHRDPDITRKCILDAALKLFSQKGYHGTNVPDVAAAASVGAGSIYRHFQDKRGLVNTLYREWKTRFRKSILEPLPEPHSSFENQFREFWGRLWRFYRSHPEALIFLDIHAHGGYLEEESRKVAIEFEKELVDWVENGQRNKAIRKGSPEVLIAMIYGSFLGLIKLEQSADPLPADVMESSGSNAWAILAP